MLWVQIALGDKRVLDAVIRVVAASSARCCFTSTETVTCTIRDTRAASSTCMHTAPDPEYGGLLASKDKFTNHLHIIVIMMTNYLHI